MQNGATLECPKCHNLLTCFIGDRTKCECGQVIQLELQMAASDRVRTTPLQPRRRASGAVQVWCMLATRACGATTAGGGLCGVNSWTTWTVGCATGDRSRSHSRRSPHLVVPTPWIARHVCLQRAPDTYSSHSSRSVASKSRKGRSSEERIMNTGALAWLGCQLPAAGRDPHLSNRTHAAPTRAGRWTKEEHEAFVQGLKLYGREWKKVANLVRATRRAVWGTMRRPRPRWALQGVPAGRAHGRGGACTRGCQRRRSPF